MQYIREAIAAHTGVQPPEPPPEPKLEDYGEVPMGQSALLLEQLGQLFPGDGIASEKPDIMEEYGQS